MAVERTLFIIKPDATGRKLVGKILAHVEALGFKLVEARYTRVTREQCNEFYAEHLGKPFFPELVDFMTSGPVMLCCLERSSASPHWRIRFACGRMGTSRPGQPGSARPGWTVAKALC